MITCKGRNGYFKFKQHWIFKDKRDQTITIGFQSQRPGKSSPVIVYGPQDEVLKLFQGITKEIKNA